MQLKRVGPSPHLPVAGSLFRSVVPAEGLRAPAHLTGLGVPVAGRPDGRVGWRVERTEHRVRLAVWGAVGDAAAAADTARTVVALPFEDTPAETLTGYHVGLFGTAGVVAAAIDIDLAERELWASAFGDVTVVVAADEKAAPVPTLPGVLGVGPPPAIAALRSHRTAWEDDLRLLAHTAGLQADEDLLTRLATTAHPVVACSTLVRDHRRDDVDVCVVAAKIDTNPHAEAVDGMMTP